MKNLGGPAPWIRASWSYFFFDLYYVKTYLHVKNKIIIIACIVIISFFYFSESSLNSNSANSYYNALPPSVYRVKVKLMKQADKRLDKPILHMSQYTSGLKLSTSQHFAVGRKQKNFWTFLKTIRNRERIEHTPRTMGLWGVGIFMRKYKFFINVTSKYNARS